MNKGFAIAALLAGTVPASPSFAQDNQELLAELKAMRAKIEALEAKVATLQAERQSPAVIAGAPPSAAVPQPAAAAPIVADSPPAVAEAAPATDILWRGAPQFRQDETGFSFRVRGFLQYDAGSVENPGDRIATANLGFNTRGRRIVFGGEGTLPGGFGYKAEFNFGGGNLDYEDVIITYAPKGVPIQVTVGNFFPLVGLEATTSSRIGSVLEREQATDAFGFVRRIGAAISLVDPNDRYGLSAGLFGTPINSGFNNDAWQASIRGYVAPKIGERGRIHVGASFQHREPQSDAQNFRYRARPFTQLTDYRFVDTAPIAAESDDIIGAELVGIFGPFHAAAEGHRVQVNGYRPGQVFDPLNGAGGGLYYAGDPVFKSGYAEIGYYLTGETRGYRGGRWDNVKVLRPVGKGGWGALQVNGRIDHLDLSDRLADGSLAAPFYINGGRQTGYQLSAIWNPVDQVRLLFQYTHIDVVGGPNAAIANPASSAPLNERGFSSDGVALRTQIEF